MRQCHVAFSGDGNVPDTGTNLQLRKKTLNPTRRASGLLGVSGNGGVSLDGKCGTSDSQIWVSQSVSVDIWMWGEWVLEFKIVVVCHGSLCNDSNRDIICHCQEWGLDMLIIYSYILFSTVYRHRWLKQILVCMTQMEGNTLDSLLCHHSANC